MRNVPRKLTRVDTGESESSNEGVVHDLEREGREGLIVYRVCVCVCVRPVMLQCSGRLLGSICSRSSSTCARNGSSSSSQTCESCACARLCACAFVRTVRLAHAGAVILDVDAVDRGHVEGRRHVHDDGVEEGLDSLVLESSAGNDGHELLLEAACTHEGESVYRAIVSKSQWRVRCDVMTGVVVQLQRQDSAQRHTA